MRTTNYISALFIACMCFLLPVSAKKSKLTDPKATAETKALFQNLMKLAENHTLFGLCGSHPAIIGIDLSGLSGRSAESIEKEKVRLQKTVVDMYNRGGVTTVAWHFSNPVSGGGFYWKDDVSKPAVKYLIPGGEAHDKYKEILAVPRI